MFDSDLKLDPDEVDFARGFPDEVRQALSDEGVRITHSFLQGSLARGTMVSPLKDVDMVVSLDRDQFGYLLDDPQGPDKAMDLLEAALEKQLRPQYPKLRFDEVVLSPQSSVLFSADGLGSAEVQLAVASPAFARAVSSRSLIVGAFRIGGSIQPNLPSGT